MTKTDAVDRDELGGVLQRAQSDLSKEEVHGIASGLLVALGSSDVDALVNHVVEGFDVQNVAHSECQALLEKMLQQITRQLNDGDLNFQLWLPDDDEAIDLRVDALAEWSQGFLLGVGMGGLKDDDSLPENVSEVITDLIEVARIGTDDEADGNDTVENDLFEIIEYVRVAVLLINEELNPVPMAARIQ